LPAGDGGTPHARSKTERFNPEHDLFRHAPDLQIARHIVGLISSLFPRFAFEGDDRELRYCKEPRTQVVVTHFDVGVDAGDVDNSLDGAVFKPVTIHDNSAFYLCKGTRHFGEEVPDVEAYPRVNRVDIVGFNGGRSEQRRAECEPDEDKKTLRMLHGDFHGGLNFSWSFLFANRRSNRSPIPRIHYSGERRP